MRETRRNKNREDDRETQNERGTKTLVRQKEREVERQGRGEEKGERQRGTTEQKRCRKVDREEKGERIKKEKEVDTTCFTHEVSARRKKKE